MAHVFAGTFGDPLVRHVAGVALARPPAAAALASGLIEGIAEAASDAGDPDGDATIHEEARAMIEAGLAPPLAAVVGAGFSTLAGRRAYTIAGSFSAFLLATRGAEKLRALYRSAGNFTDVYRVPLADLEARVAPVPGAAAADHARAGAGERGVPPPRDLQARVRARAGGAPGRGARHPARRSGARRRDPGARPASDDPGEPTYRLALAEALALAGERERALAMLGRLAVDADVTVPLRAQAASLAAEINFVAGDYVRADIEQRRAAELASSEADRRQALAKLRALDSDPPARRWAARCSATSCRGPAPIRC